MMSGVEEGETDLLYVDAVASTAEDEACSHSFCEAPSLVHG